MSLTCKLTHVCSDLLVDFTVCLTLVWSTVTARCMYCTYIGFIYITEFIIIS